MGHHHVQTLENETRTLLGNPEPEDDAVLDLQNVQLNERERAMLEKLSSGPCKRAKFVSEDSHTAAQSCFGMPTRDGVFGSLHNQQETLAMQAQVSGSRVTAGRVPSGLPEKQVTPYESPLFNSCFKVLLEMTNGAYREKCPDLMEFLAEELIQVQKRYNVLVKVGSDAGYGSPAFQRAVEVWRNVLHMATDPAYQAEQAKNVWGAVTFTTTLEKISNPEPEEPEPTTTGKYKKLKYADPPSMVDVYRRTCERLTRELLDGATRTQQPMLLLELLLEDFQHVQRRQQALFRAELAVALEPLRQNVERVTSKDVSTATAGGVPSSLLEKEWEPEREPDESSLYTSCFKLLSEMADEACREQCPDLGEYFCQELLQVQNRQNSLIQAGSNGGYDSPSFQNVVVAWRRTLHMATDPAYQAQQAMNSWRALTFEQTLERLQNADKRSAQATRGKADPPLGNSFNRNVESVGLCCEVTFRLLHEANSQQRPEVLLELLLEDLKHVQRRQQVLLRAEMATAINPPKQMVEQITCNVDSSESILTAGGFSMGREIMNPTPQLVPNPVSSVTSPFTASQWVEFEHQALIFKYMMAGVRVMSVPKEILDPIRKSVVSTNGTASHPAPNLGSGVGVANNTDPEPHRCRRTDGKKWRCAREVVPDQKHCEHHMHRGRHRSSPATSSGQTLRQAAQ